LDPWGSHYLSLDLLVCYFSKLLVPKIPLGQPLISLILNSQND